MRNVKFHSGKNKLAWLAAASVLVVSSFAQANNTSITSTLPVVTALPLVVQSGTCAPGLYLNVVQASGVAVTLANSLTVNVIGNSTTTFYSDNKCTTPLPQAAGVSTVTFPVGAVAQIVVYAKDTVASDTGYIANVTGLNATMYALKQCDVTPLPPTPFPATDPNNQDTTKSQALVSGSQGSPDGNQGPMAGMVTLTTGEIVPTWIVNPATYASQCNFQQSSNTASFQPEAIPAGKQALAVFWGTPRYDNQGNPITSSGTGALANATIRMMQYTSVASKNSSCSGGTVTCSGSTCYCGAFTTVSASTSMPGNIPADVVAAARTSLPAPASSAAGNPYWSSLVYLAVPQAPQSIMPGQYVSYTISTSDPGDIGQNVQADVVGVHNSTPAVKGFGGGTNYSPLLKFTSSPETVTVSSCSYRNNLGQASPPLTMVVTDGNGTQTSVLPGNSLINTGSSNTLTLSPTSSSTNLFADNVCFYPFHNNAQPGSIVVANYIHVTGKTTSGSTSITGISSMTGLVRGLPITGPGIPSGATISTLSGSTITLNVAATASATGVALVVSPTTQPNGAPTSPIAMGPDQINFYFKGNTAEPFTMQMSYSLNNISTTASLLETILPAIPSSIAVSGAASVDQGTCSSGLTVSLYDKFGSLSSVTGCTKTLTLSGDSSATFYSDANCTTPLSGNQLTFAAGTSQKTFYMKGGTSENLPVSVSDSTNYGSSGCVADANGEVSLGSSVQHVEVLTSGAVAPPDPTLVAALTRNLYVRLIGAPPAPNDPVYLQMLPLVTAGQIYQAADIATNQDGFYNTTIRNMVTPISNQLFTSLYPLNDFVTTWIGVTRDNLDARTLLTGDFIYAPSSYGSCSGKNCTNLAGACASTSVTSIFDSTSNSSFNINSDGSPADIYSNGAAFQAMDDHFVNIRQNIVKVPQCAYNSYDPSSTPTLLKNSHLSNGTQQASAAAGVLTSRAWGIAHLYQGTNRRAIREAFNVFLCKDITDIADPTIVDGRIRRDVDRAPAGNSNTFNATCRGCHAGMDALAGAYAFFDTFWPNSANQNEAVSVASSTMRVIYNDTSNVAYSGEGPDGSCNTTTAMPKTTRNCHVAIDGYIVADDTWENHFIANQNASLNWDPSTPLTGTGVTQLGNMLANSGQFAACMTTRVFTQVCKRAPASTDAADVARIAQDFKDSQYSMRRLFGLTATLPACLSNGGGN